MNIYTASLLSFSFGVLLIGVLAFIKRQDKAGRHFLFFSLVVAGWGLPHSLWLTQNYKVETLLCLARTAHAFANFIPILWFHFVLILLGKREPFSYFLISGYSLASFLTVMSPSAWFISGMQSVAELQYYTKPGPLFHFYTASFLIFVPVGFIYLLRQYRVAGGRDKSPLKMLMIATVIGFSCGSVMFPPTYGIPFPLWLLAGMPLYPLLMGIALIRYGLFDIEQIAQALRKERLAALGMLTASVNHEIRSPLYIVQGMCENYLARIDEPGRPANETNTVHKILEQVTRTSKIITKYSSMAKQNTRDAPNKKNVSVKRVLHEIDPLIGPTLEENEIELDVAIEADQIFIDQSDLEEILLNLIQNACQVMAEKKGQIEIACKKEQASVRLEVRDNGPGLSEREKVQIFEPFFSTKNEGSGLGLYIVKQLVERNGGKIKVESAPGKGTRFEMEFPV